MYISKIRIGNNEYLIKDSEARQDIPRVFIDGIIPTTKDEVSAELTYISKSETFHAYLLIKCQGTSSMAYPKKNFTIKLYEDTDHSIKLKRDFLGWGAQNKFCLKANYIDNTHARNIVCARLWSKACASRENLNERLAAAPNNGAIDGFHIKLYANGIYQGLYTWNIPKDGWMFDMDDNGNEAVYCCEVQTAAGQFRQEILGDESDWSLEYPDIDEVNPSVLTGFNNLVRFVRDSSDEEFMENLPQILDIEAAIDYYLFCYYFCALDQLGKNMLMITYDGGSTWIPSAYDNDSTWGSWWDGTYMVTPEYKCPEEYQCSDSLLWKRLEELFGERLYSRYQELVGVNGPWSLPNIISEIEEFYGIPEIELYTEDKTIYPNIPTGVTFSAMRNFMAQRKPYVDNCLYEIGVVISLEGIELQKNEITLGAGDKINLRLFFIPSNARNKEYTVISDNELVQVEKNGSFVTLAVADDIDSSQTAIITITSKENSTLTSTLTINLTPNNTQSFEKPIIAFDSKTYANGTWTDLAGSKSMVFSGTPSATEDGVKFDGSQYFYFDNTNLRKTDIAIEFKGIINESENGFNILTVGPDTSFNWYTTYCIWQDSLEQVIFQYCSSPLVQDIPLDDSKKYTHFLVTLPATHGGESKIYINLDGKMITYSGVLGGTNTPNWSYISNAEGTNHFRGVIRELNVYNYIPTDTQAKEILGIIEEAPYRTINVASTQMELGSLTNYAPYGTPIDYDQEIRTKNYLEIPDGVSSLALNQYFGEDKLYFYDDYYNCDRPHSWGAADEKVTIPENAKYLKFLLQTTTPVDTVITYYR